MSELNHRVDLHRLTAFVSYYDAARFCFLMNDARMTLQWTEKELEVDRNCVGEDHADYIKGLEVVERMKETVQNSVPFHKCVVEWFAEPFAN